MSKPIKLFIISETYQGLVCRYVRSAFNIENLFRYMQFMPKANDTDSQRCIEAIKHNGAMFAFLGHDVKKFHYSREALLEEVNYHRTMANVISNM